LRKPFDQDYLLVEQLLEIIFTLFTLKVVDEAPAPAPDVEVLAEEDGVVEEPEAASEPLAGVPITRI
jgi:hypothetical protein